jgi:hypothetical protein
MPGTATSHICRIFLRKAASLSHLQGRVEGSASILDL